MKLFLLIFSCLPFLQPVFSQLPAFPTAEGAGKYVTGGRGTSSVAPIIYEVTSLVDNASSGTTAGTFRYACTNNSPAAPNRIIVFRVSGTIHLFSALTLTRANTTIAGQTAPGEGICIADYPVYLGANNIIVRYLRFRLGDKNQLVTTPANCGIPTTPFAANPGCIPTANASGNDDAFGDNGNGRVGIVIDHCSMSWSNDEAFTVYKGNNVTLQWNILSEPLNYSYHVESGDTDYELHAYGGIWGGTNSSMHHNLLAHCKGRMPRFDGTRNIPTELVDFRNNVIYDWGDYNTNGGEGGNYNVVNNYYKYGPATLSVLTNGVNRRNMIINPYKSASAAVTTYGNYYLTGNYCDNSAAVTSDNWLGVSYNNGNPTPAELTAMKQTTPFAVTNINMETALDAYNSVLQKAGCTLPNRDTLDARIVNDVLNRTGGLIDCQGKYPHATPYSTSQTAWPTLTSGTAQTDTDHDGMPDTWEDARGLNKNLATDRNGYSSTSGYNNVENYINGDTIVAVGTLNTCVAARKINSSNTGNWLHARDIQFSDYQSTQYTSSTDSNQIVASILDNGNFGEFSVSYYTTNVNRINAGWNYARRNITITPTNPALITAPVTVRLYISLAEFNALKATDITISTINDIQIMKSADNTCITSMPATFSAIIPTSAALFGTYQNGYYIEFQTSSFSTFFFQSKSAPAPVKLSSFLVQKTGIYTAAINWITQQEINSSHFELQRSKDGTGFTTIATIAAAGNSSVPLSYSFRDYEYKNGIYFYRLAMIDRNAALAYSEIRKLNFSGNPELQLYPNPVLKSFTVHIAGESNFRLQITDCLGRKLTDRLVDDFSRIDVSELSNGTYLIKIQTKSGSINSKFIKN
jgi:hypothetical protein